MISHALKLTFVLIAGAFVPAAWACYPAPNAKPSHKISRVELPQDRAGSAVVFESQGFAIHVSAEDLLSVLSKPHMAVATPGDLANALRSQMPLAQDFSTRDLVAAVFSDPGATAQEDARMEYHRLIMQSEGKLRYAFSTLLQSGKGLVVQTSTGHTLAHIRLDTFREICHGGRLFMDSDGKEILRMVDWVS